MARLAGDDKADDDCSSSTPLLSEPNFDPDGGKRESQDSLGLAMQRRNSSPPALDMADVESMRQGGKLHRVGDAVILTMSEALKSAIRESSRVFGRMSNAVASTLVNLLFAPGYSYFSRSRYDTYLPQLMEISPSRLAELLRETLSNVSIIQPREVSAERRPQVVACHSQSQRDQLGMKRFLASLMVRLLSLKAFFVTTQAGTGSTMARITRRGAKVLHLLQHTESVSQMVGAASSTGLLEDLTDRLTMQIDAMAAWVRRAYSSLLRVSVSQGGHPLMELFHHVPVIAQPRFLPWVHPSHTASVIDSVCGYPVQCFTVETVDGYLLRLVRIPRPTSRRVVYYQHGLLDSSAAWVSNGHVFSLALRAFLVCCVLL